MTVLQEIKDDIAEMEEEGRVVDHITLSSELFYKEIHPVLQLTESAGVEGTSTESLLGHPLKLKQKGQYFRFSIQYRSDDDGRR